jgi:hypothetical protein
MINQRSSYPILTLILLIAPLFVLVACGQFSFLKQRHPPLTKSIQVEQYVLIQALAALVLDKDPNDKIQLKSYAKSLNSSEKGKEKESQIAVLAMEYSLRDQSEKRILLVPVPVTPTMPSFNALQQVQKNLSALPYTLHNLRAYYVTVSFPAAQKFSSEAVVLRQQLDEERQILMNEAVPLAAYENATLQLQLVQFFMKMHVRDAAYLALENAKDMLAILAEQTAEVDITSLSQKTDMLESKLHKEMPYKF